MDSKLSKVIEYLIENKSAIRHELASKICKGEVTELVLSNNYFTKTNQIYFMIDQNKCYGLVKLNSGTQLKESEYSYPLTLLAIFEEPRDYIIPAKIADDGTIIANIEFKRNMTITNSEKIELLKPVRLMEPSKIFTSKEELMKELKD